jgi:hypothetical protein
MGNSKSTIRNENNVNIVNKSAISAINEQNTSIVNNTIINEAKSAFGSASGDQTIKINFVVASGSSLKLDALSMSQKLDVNFKSVQSSTVQQKAAAEIINNMLSNISKSVENDVLTKMIADATAKSESSFLSIPPPGVTQNVDNISNTNISNENFIDLRNVISNEVTNNFKKETVDSCVSSLSGKQNLDLTITITESSQATLGPITLDQVIKQVSECQQISTTMNDITTGLMNKFDLKSVEDTANKSTTEQAATTTTELKASGLFEGLSTLFSSIGKTYLMGIGLSSCLSFCCCCICLIFLLIMMKGGGGG